MKDREFLMWLHERLEHVHHENPLVDYMRKLRAIIYGMPEYHDTSPFRGEGSLDELKKAIIKLDESQQEKPSAEENLDLDTCPQCDEEAWDGRLCHACGAKDI